MIKIIIIALFAGALVLFAMRVFPALRSQIQRLLQNPFLRAILFKGLWRLVRLLLFRRQSKSAVSFWFLNSCAAVMNYVFDSYWSNKLPLYPTAILGILSLNSRSMSFHIGRQSFIACSFLYSNICPNWNWSFLFQIRVIQYRVRPFLSKRGMNFSLTESHFKRLNSNSFSLLSDYIVILISIIFPVFSNKLYQRNAGT